MSIPETTGNTFLLAHARPIPPGVRNPFALAAIPINLERKPAKNMDPRVLAGDSVDSRIGLLVDNKSISLFATSPSTQALRSPTFKAPPLDGSLTIAQIYDWHFQNTLFIDCLSMRAWMSLLRKYAGSRQFKRFMRVHIFPGNASSGPWNAGNARRCYSGVLWVNHIDTIPYFILVMSCLRANYVPFPISPRSSPSAVANLISKAGVRHLLIGHEPAMAHLAEDAIGILKEEYSTTAVPDVSYVPSFEDLFISASDTRPTPEDLPFESHAPMRQHALFTHPHAHVSWSVPPYSLRVSSSPHASSGLVLSAFEPKSPPTIPTPENLFLAAKATGSDIVFCVPSFIEAWSCKPEYVQWLATPYGSADEITKLYGDGPLNKDTGNYMTSHCVEAPRSQRV
ncbi:hypothetical protein B0H13DRAFT_1933686 [Mycena leptocephala]|nr:hypothetical protein B0H13DRAFT_1933686 [Mycena leptocephala]